MSCNAISPPCCLVCGACASSCYWLACVASNWHFYSRGHVRTPTRHLAALQIAIANRRLLLVAANAPRISICSSLAAFATFKAPAHCNFSTAFCSDFELNFFSAAAIANLGLLLQLIGRPVRCRRSRTLNRPRRKLTGFATMHAQLQ